ncbi:MAG TPA: hypothetical protein VGH86_03775 [Phenylobacterium sp.]|jgi:hypothetical protein
MSFAANCRRLGLALSVSVLVAAPAMAQTYDGDWAGALEAGGQKLRLELHVKTDAKGTNAVIDSLDQGATIPATAVKTEGGQLNILFLSIGGELTGKLSPDGKQIVGTWAQGQTMPLTLTKK